MNTQTDKTNEQEKLFSPAALGQYGNANSIFQRKDNRQESALPLKVQGIINRKKDAQLADNVGQLRSKYIAQLQYAWSGEGEAGVLIDPDGPLVIKLDGYGPEVVALDDIARRFGFNGGNARIVREGDDEWATVLRAVEEHGGWNRDRTAAPKTQALVMDKVVGSPIHESSDAIKAEDPANPTQAERAKIVRLCTDMGKMLVMDLLTRNTDRFDFTDFDVELQATEEEKTPDGDGWRQMGGNEENTLIDPATGAANPIDSEFTPATDESAYAHNVANLLLTREDDLIRAGMSLLVTNGYNWCNQAYAQNAFRQGIQEGIQRLLAL